MADLRKILSKLQSEDAEGFEQLSDEEAAELQGGTDNNSGCPSPSNKSCTVNSGCPTPPPGGG